MKIKSTFSFDKIADAKLKDIAKNTRTTKSEVLRRALTLYDYIQKVMDEDGTITLKRADGQKVKLLIP